MRKIIFALIAVVMILAAGPAMAQDITGTRVCLQMDHGALGVQPWVYKLRYIDLGDGDLLIVGKSYTTLVTNPEVTIQRVLTGGAALIDGQLEVQITTTDIQDRVNTNKIDGLAVSDVHMLLDPATWAGTFEAVGIHYPVATDDESAPITNSLSGTVTRIDCE